MENQHPEALILANDRPSTIGDDLYQWAHDAEDMIRRLHARVQELEKDRGNAKRLVSKIWDKHPEARGAIEEGTGAWLVFGQDVETSGVSAQRVTQSQPLKASSDWLIEGGLLYRLNDRGTNCDEINVTMAGGLRTEAARVERAEAILNMLTIQKAADHIGKPSWDSHQWPQIVQDSSGNWFGVREGWTMRIAPSYKGDELWLLREDGEFLSHGERSQGWRTSLEQRPTTKPTPAELTLDDYYCKGCGRIGEIEELSAQDKAKLRKIEGKPKTVAAPVEVPKVGSAWRHKNGNAYRVVAIANDCDAHFSERYPVTVVYQGENGKMWARRADDWHRSMTHDATAPSTAPVVLPEPDEYQYRMKPNWDDKLPWTPWEACSKESAASLRKRNVIHNWIFEVRERYTDQQVRELLAKDLDAVNLDRLGKALTKLGHAKWVSQAEAAAEIPRWVNALTSCVLEMPEAAPQPQAGALDATQILIRPAAAQKIPRDPIPTVDTWETCTIKEAKELNPALWRVRMLYPQEAIDAAIAASKENK